MKKATTGAKDVNAPVQMSFFDLPAWADWQAENEMFKVEKKRSLPDSHPVMQKVRADQWAAYYAKYPDRKIRDDKRIKEWNERHK